MIYLDNGATTFHKPESVIQAVADAMRCMGNSGRGSHEASLKASRIIYDTRAMLAAMFGLRDPSRVAFTANSTESLNMAIQGLFSPGDHVITTALEHNSVLRPLYRLREQGVELTIVRADRQGNIRYEDIREAVKPSTKGVVCTHGSNLTGNLVDIGRVGKICAEAGILLVVDASQTAGVFDIDMEAMGIDVLCFTGHKSLLGPQGTGGICVREGVEAPGSGGKRSSDIFPGPSAPDAGGPGGRHPEQPRNRRASRGPGLYRGDGHGAHLVPGAYAHAALLRGGARPSRGQSVRGFLGHGPPRPHCDAEHPGL